MGDGMLSLILPDCALFADSGKPTMGHVRRPHLDGQAVLAYVVKSGRRLQQPLPG